MEIDAIVTAAGRVDAALPPAVRDGLAPAVDEASAEAFTRGLALGHYENFSVVSFLLPRRLRQDFCNVYAFCRVADDAGDEMHDVPASLNVLQRMRELTLACFAGESSTNVFCALAATIRRHQVPIEPFLNLIDAFEQDQRIKRYDTYEQLLDYCRRSANPVGRLVLHLCGYRDPFLAGLSDCTCTALQLTNFWQDVRRDLLERGRIYLPRDSMDAWGVTEAQLREGRCDDNYRGLIRFEVKHAEEMFDRGDKLLPWLNLRVRKQVALFSMGGRAVLRAIRRRNYDTLTARPSLSKWQKIRLMLLALLGAPLARGQTPVINGGAR